MQDVDGFAYLGPRIAQRTPVLLYRVDTRQGHAHLCSENLHWEPERRFVVLVDTARFAAVWRQELGNEGTSFAFGDPQTWSCDRKFHKIEAFMPTPAWWPAPVPRYHCSAAPASRPASRNERLLGLGRVSLPSASIFIEDGVTRTLWLAHNGAPCYPVECVRQDDANRLHRVAGRSGSAIHRIADLVP